MNELLVAAGLGVVVGAAAGSVVTALVAARRSTKRAQGRAVVETTLECYQEFLSREMRESRVRAEAVLRRNEESAEPKSFGHLASTCGIEDWEAVTRLVHYFEKVAMLHSIGSIDLTVARRTLGPYFVRYYDHYLAALGARSVGTDRSTDGRTDAAWHSPLAELNAALHPPAGRWSPAATPAATATATAAGPPSGLSRPRQA